MAPFKMLKLAPGRHSAGEMKVVETFKWLCENESFVSLFTFISLFLARRLFQSEKRNRSKSACLAF